MICCPNCDSARIHQSRRKGIVEKVILALLFVRPFRCERCDERFFRWRFSTSTDALRLASLSSFEQSPRTPRTKPGWPPGSRKIA
jgi:hypothetical protein